MQQSSGRRLAAAVVLVTVAAVLLSTVDGATLTRRVRDVSSSRLSRRLSNCNLNGVCGFQVFGGTYDEESDFIHICHCAMNCQEDYFNLGNGVTTFRCRK